MSSPRVHQFYGQSWLINHMRRFGFPADAEGVCFGISFMAIQAILADELDLFDARLVAIHETSENILAPNINILRNRMKYARLIPEKYENWLEIPAFFDGVLLYQEISTYAHLLENPSAVKLQDPSQTFPLVMSQKNKSLGGITELYNDSGIYNESELYTYFKSFQDAVELANPKLTQAIAFRVADINHSITISFDPKTNSWIFIDPNLLPSWRGLSAHNLATLVKWSFSDNEIDENNHTTITAHIYSTPQHADSIKNVIETWQNLPALKTIRSVTPEKAKLSDSKKVSWLYLAAKNGHLEVVKKLLAANADLNEVNTTGTTPLCTAVSNSRFDSQLEIVKEMIAAHADVNFKSKGGVSPLTSAILGQNPLTMKELIKAGAYVNEGFYQKNGERVPLIGIAMVTKNNETIRLLQLAIELNRMLDGEIFCNSVRYRAIQKCYRDCFNAKTNDETFEIFSSFKKLDNTAIELRLIYSSYSSDSFFQKNNPKRDASALQLKQAVNAAYQSYNEDSANLNTALSRLIAEAGTISDETKADHISSGSVFSRITNSRLASQIDKTVQPRRS